MTDTLEKLERDEKLSLQDIMELLARIENGDDIPKWAKERVGDRLKSKLDAYRFRIDELRAQALVHKQYEKEQKTAKAALENQADNLENRLKYFMKSMGFEELPGKQFTFKGSKPVVDYKLKKGLRTPTAQDKLKYGDLVTVKREWSPSTVKEKAKLGDELALSLAEKTEERRYKFATNRKKDNEK